eukprot:5172677-Prymnesium_polylepis.1
MRAWRGGGLQRLPTPPDAHRGVASGGGVRHAVRICSAPHPHRLQAHSRPSLPHKKPRWGGGRRPAAG